MSDTVGVAGDRIRSFVERIEQLDTELQEINEQKKEVFAEAKGEVLHAANTFEWFAVLVGDADARTLDRRRRLGELLAELQVGRRREHWSGHVRDVDRGFRIDRVQMQMVKGRRSEHRR